MKIFVRPGRDGLIVPVPPRGRWVPAAGMLVEHDEFIARRLACGDLVRAEVPLEDAPPQPAHVEMEHPEPAPAAHEEER